MVQHRARPRFLRPAELRRPLLAVPASVAAALLIVVAAVVVGKAVACASVPITSRSFPGQATFYELGSGMGNCSYAAPSDRLYVALGNADYAEASACGAYLSVTGPRGSVRVLVVDRCPECESGHLDLSAEAFRAIADPAQGLVDITFRLVIGPDRLAYRIKDGSNPHWLAVQPVSAGRPVTKLELQTGTGWTALTRTDYNYFVAESGAGPGPFTIRLTDYAGGSTITSGIALSPGSVQSRGGTASGAAPSSSRPSAVPTPTVTASPTPTSTVSASASVDASASDHGSGLAEALRGGVSGGGRCS